MKFPKIKPLKDKKLIKGLKIVFWFTVGVVLGLFLLVSFSLVIFQKLNQNNIYPGIMVNGVDFGGKKEEEVINYFKSRNLAIENTRFEFIGDKNIATVSAKTIDLGYDYNLLSTQAYSLGRSKNLISNFTIIFLAYINGINLPPSYGYSDAKLTQELSPVVKNMHIAPVNSIFNFQNGRVIEFKPSKNGQDVDLEKLKNDISSRTGSIVSSGKTQNISIKIPVKIIEPEITTDKANSMGIRELLGRGTSTYFHSIPGRIYNVGLATSRINGVLVPPDSVFSFNEALGDVSAFTGYKQAYVILNGKTVLGDGGGVCQVSTTLFRAILNAGLPIVERHAHAYRVGYYEQDSGPGIDATVFSPTVDLKFKNDTGNYILIQTINDPINLALTFDIYGTKDGREISMIKPIITSQSPAPPTVYQDDPTLPKDQLKQVDFSAAGASVYFTRQVSKNGKVIISDNFSSNYRPWAAVYLRGTKEN